MFRTTLTEIPVDIYTACANGNMDAVRYWIDKGTNLNTRNIRGEMTLQLAIKHGETAVIQELLNRGSDVHAIFNDGQRPLHYAVLDKSISDDVRLKIIEILLSKITEPQMWNKEGETAIHAAVRIGSLCSMTKLLDKGMSIYAQDKDGNTLLHIAVLANNLKIAEYLLKRGLDVNVKNANQQTALHFAAKSANTEFIKWLLGQKIDISAKDITHYTALHYAAQKLDINVIKSLESKGAMIADSVSENQALVHIAAAGGNEDLVQELLRDGSIDVNLPDNRRITILHYAGQSGNIELVKWLIAQHANIHAKDTSQRIVLHYAAQSGNLELVKELLKHDLDINAKTDVNRTVFHFAAQSGNMDLIVFLKEQQAEVTFNDKDLNGVLPIYLALQSGKLTMNDSLKTLLEGSFPSDNAGNTIMHYAASSDNSEIVQYLFTLPAFSPHSAHSHNTENISPFHIAISLGNTAMVTSMLPSTKNISLYSSDSTKCNILMQSLANSNNVDLIEKIMTPFNQDYNFRTNNFKDIPRYVSDYMYKDMSRYCSKLDFINQAYTGNLVLVEKHLISSEVSLEMLRRAVTSNGVDITKALLKKYTKPIDKSLIDIADRQHQTKILEILKHKISANLDEISPTKAKIEFLLSIYLKDILHEVVCLDSTLGAVSQATVDRVLQKKEDNEPKKILVVPILLPNNACTGFILHSNDGRNIKLTYNDPLGKTLVSETKSIESVQAIVRNIMSISKHFTITDLQFKQTEVISDAWCFVIDDLVQLARGSELKSQDEMPINKIQIRHSLVLGNKPAYDEFKICKILEIKLRGQDVQITPFDLDLPPNTYENKLQDIISAVTDRNWVSVVPIHLYNEAWAGLVIKQRSDCNPNEPVNIEIFYNDPRGVSVTKEEKVQKFLAMLTAKYADNSIEDLRLIQVAQDKTKDSGTYVVEDLVLLTISNTEDLNSSGLRKLLGGNIKGDCDIIREQHLVMLGQEVGVDLHDCMQLLG